MRGASPAAPSSQDVADADWKFYGGDLCHDDGNDGQDGRYATIRFLLCIMECCVDSS